jgi:hypothetical protein
MSESKQAQRRRRTDEQTPEQAPADQRNAELDEDVECCLAEIDAALEAAETERDRAVREFRELRERWEQADADRWDGEDVADAAAALDAVDEELRVWAAAYAHLQLQVRYSCCGTPFAYDTDTDTYLS